MQSTQTPIIKCDICTGEIGYLDPEKWDVPIRGDMILPIYEDAKDLPLYNPMAEWEHMRCPLCNYRPFLTEGKITTDQGDYVVGVGWITGPNQIDLSTDPKLDKEWEFRERERTRKQEYFAAKHQAKQEKAEAKKAEEAKSKAKKQQTAPKKAAPTQVTAQDGGPVIVRKSAGKRGRR